MSLSKQSQDLNIKLDRRQSMDRLNDDCVGLVLSYLSLQDKFRLECVSKQWKRKMFLYVDRVKIILKDLEPIKVGIGSYKREYDFYLSDCSPMTSIPNEKSDEVFQVIFAKCENIETVEFESFNSKEFCHKLRTNQINDTRRDIESVLAIIANDCHGLSYFRLIYGMYDEQQQSFEVFKYFFNNCGHKLKKLDLLNLHN
jgi:F-box domain